MKQQTRKDLKDIKNLSLSWLVIIVSALMGWLIGINLNHLVGYLVSATLAVFLTLLIWNNTSNL